MADTMPAWERTVRFQMDVTDKDTTPGTAKVRSGDFTDEDVLSLLKELTEPIALLDRPTLEAQWRRVFLSAEDETAADPTWLLVFADGSKVHEADTPHGIVTTSELVKEFGSWYELPTLPEEEEQVPDIQGVTDKSVIMWQFQGGEAEEPAMVRVREGDPSLPANKAMLLGKDPGVHELVRLSDLDKLPTGTFTGDSKHIPAMLMRGTGNKVAGTLYGATAWPWPTIENKEEVNLFSGVHYVGHESPIEHGHMVSIDQDDFEEASTAPPRYLVLIAQVHASGQFRYSALLFNEKEGTLEHVGLSYVRAAVPRVSIDEDGSASMRLALTNLTSLSSPKAACEHSRRALSKAKAAAAQRKAAAKAVASAAASKAAAAKLAAEVAAAAKAGQVKKPIKKGVKANKPPKKAAEAAAEEKPAEAEEEEAEEEEDEEEEAGAGGKAEAGGTRVAAVVGGEQSVLLQQLLGQLNAMKEDMRVGMQARDQEIAALKEQLKGQATALPLCEPEPEPEPEQPRFERAGIRRRSPMGEDDASERKSVRYASIQYARMQAEDDARASMAWQHAVAKREGVKAAWHAASMF